MTQMQTEPKYDAAQVASYQRQRADWLLKMLGTGVVGGVGLGVGVPLANHLLTGSRTEPADLPGADVIHIGQVAAAPKLRKSPKPRAEFDALMKAAKASKRGQASAPAVATPPTPSADKPSWISKAYNAGRDMIAPAMPVEPGNAVYGGAFGPTIGLAALAGGTYGGYKLISHLMNQLDSSRRTQELEQAEQAFDQARQDLYMAGRKPKSVAGRVPVTQRKLAELAKEEGSDLDKLAKAYVSKEAQAAEPSSGYTLAGKILDGINSAANMFTGAANPTGTTGEGMMSPTMRNILGLTAAAGAGGLLVGGLHGMMERSPTTREDLQKLILRRRMGVRDQQAYTPMRSTLAVPADDITTKYIEPPRG